MSRPLISAYTNPATEVELVAALLDELEGVEIARNLALALLTFNLWEILITLDEEVTDVMREILFPTAHL